ncbi:MAG TPA: DUF721 domain-containing protein [Candidatus Baltobacteraceae bacterium]|jgi:hypothetical protein|nr:DUF721 domain-containing protein [Candidatus Baltobacteraceae bacterium]
MKTLTQALATWRPDASERLDPVSLLRAEWTAIVGDEVAANSRPAELIRDALLIQTRSSAWSQQLAFLSETILSSVKDRTGLELRGLRFRVARLAQTPAAGGKPRTGGRRAREERLPAQTLQAAFERFHGSVIAAQRAKERAGWKECDRCGVRTAPASRACCTPCENTRLQERDAQVARLLFEAPWLGYEGIAELVDSLSPQEYEAIRLRLLRRWKDVLEVVRRTGGVHLSTRDRMIASSYVLLKSRLDPERIAPAVVRNLLGDELHGILYGNENS